MTSPSSTAHPPPEHLLPLPAWAAQQGLTPLQARRLRGRARLEPVYHHHTLGQNHYYLTPATRILSTRTAGPSQPLEGYVPLHELEAQHGPLRETLARLAGARRLIPVGQHPVLLREADVGVLLEGRDQGEAILAQEPAREPARSEPDGSADGQNNPVEPTRALEPELSQPARVLLEPSRPETSSSGLPFVPQLGWVTIPRFEGRLEPAGVLILDRGARAEHLHAPRPQAQFFDSDLARQVFPVLDLRPLERVPHSVNPPKEGMPGEGTQENLPDDAGSDDEVAHLCAQLERAQAQLEEAQHALERERSGPDAGAAHARMPDRRMRQLETALAERDTLKAALEQLEAEQQRLLADQAQLRGQATRVSHLGHVRERLLERFSLTFTEAQVEALDRQAQALPAVGYTLQDKPFKRLQLGDHTVYALMGRDEHGEVCMATVYDEAMFQKAQQRRSRRQ